MGGPPTRVYFGPPFCSQERLTSEFRGETPSKKGGGAGFLSHHFLSPLRGKTLGRNPAGSYVARNKQGGGVMNTIVVSEGGRAPKGYELGGGNQH